MLHNRPRPAKPVHKMPTDPKPVLEMKQLPVFRVHRSNLEKYVKTVFGFDYDFLHAAGVTEGIGVEYNVDGELPSPAYERQAADLRLGRRTRDPALILNVLARDGYIPKGRYTVATTALPVPIQAYRVALAMTGDPNSKACLDLKAKHRNDKNFVAQAKALDDAVLKAQEPTP